MTAKYTAEQLASFIHDVARVLPEEHEKGLEIGERFFMLQISCYSEYGDEDFSVNDMILHDFLHCDLKNVALDTLYCGYHTVPMKKRPEALYGIITSARKKELSLEALLQHGEEELPKFSEFLKVWIE